MILKRSQETYEEWVVATGLGRMPGRDILTTVVSVHPDDWVQVRQENSLNAIIFAGIAPVIDEELHDGDGVLVTLTMRPGSIILVREGPDNLPKVYHCPA